MNCVNHSDREKTAFCQNCGKALCQECTRAVGQAVFCEPCLAIKIGGAGAVPPAGAYNEPIAGFATGAPNSASSSAAYGYSAPAAGVYTPGVMPPPPHGAPNPLLAGFLGFIPGVGAMYNEQYAKAGVHLIVFVILVSIANNHDIFGLFVAGWEFYMAFEAYHTARCRRDGLPLPNPFGLNELGQKLGFDKGFHAPAAGSAPLPPDPYAATSYGTVPPAGVPPGYPPAPTAYTPYTPGAVPPNWGVPPTPGWEQYTPPMPPAGVPLDSRVPYPGNRFPAGAIWLIGLGAIFLVFNAGFMNGYAGRLFLPIFLFGFAVFIFIRKLSDSGYGLTNDGSFDYRIRVFRALRGSVWLALVGLLFFLDEFTPLHWGHSWPLFIILAGVMTVLQRAVYSGTGAGAPPYMPGYGYPAPQPPVSAAPPVPASPVAEPAVIVPASTHDVSSNDVSPNVISPNDKEGS